jgi:hypothetical protein
MSGTPSPRPAAPHFPPLEVPPDLAIEYVNLVRIAHSPSEIVFDFAQLLPGNQAARMQSRIVMSPLGAKLFFRALAENLSKFENTYGEINVPSGTTLADQLFKPPPPPEDPSKR